LKKQISRFMRYINGIQGLILILYTTFIFSAYFFYTTGQVIYYWIRWTLFVFVLSALVCPWIIRWLKEKDFCRAEEAERIRRKDRKWRLIFLLVPLSVLLLKYIVYYPGGMSPDSIVQYQQAVTGNYNDWHPVIQTILSFTLPLKLTGGWIGSIVLFQVIVLSLTITYALLTIREYAGDRFAFLSMLFMVLNPAVTNTAMFPWKDVTFAIGALLLASVSFRICMTHGKWITKPVNAVVFAVIAALTSVVRHNGPLFTIPLVLAVVLWVGFRKTILVCAGIVILVAGIRIPLYSALGVQPAGERKIEVLGLPLNVIAVVAKYAPQDLDEETLAFVQEAGPKEVWNRYNYGNFNNVKWESGFDESVVEKHAGRILPMAWSCFTRNPVEALRGLIRLTDVVYTICDDYVYLDFPYLAIEGYGFEKGGIPALQTVNEQISLILFTILPWLFLYIGAMHYGLLALALARFRLNRWKDWKRLFFVFPVFFYNCGTALLLTSAHDSARFFCYTFLVTPVMAALLCCRDEGQGQAEQIEISGAETL